jgi:hypothetical protein
MKTKIIFSLSAVVLASLISMRAADNPAQAAARAALEQELNGLDNPQTQPEPAMPPTVTTLQPDESATNESATDMADTDADVLDIIDTLLADVVIPQIAPAEINPTDSPAVETVAVVNPVVVAPIVAAPTVIVHVASVATTKALPAAELALSTPTAPAPAPVVKKLLSQPMAAKPANEIATTDGEIYKNTQVEKVERDGIIVSYSSPGGGLGMSKIYFADLSAEARQKYERK